MSLKEVLSEITMLKARLALSDLSPGQTMELFIALTELQQSAIVMLVKLNEGKLQ